MLDGRRIPGIRAEKPEYERGYQVVLVNNNSDKKFDDTALTIDIYRQNELEAALHPAVNWWGISREERRKIHLNGINPLDVIRASDPISRGILMGVVEEPDVGGLVLSSHGISVAPRGRNDTFTANNLLTAAISSGKERTIPPEMKELKGLVKALEPMGSRSRTVVTDKLLAEYIPRLASEADVRAFLLNSYGTLFMSKETHSGLTKTAREGVAIAWNSPTGLRELHSMGLWVVSEQMDRVDRIDLRLATYGTAKDHVGQLLARQLDDFFIRLASLTEADRVAIVQGAGPGAMEEYDRAARSTGIMSWGFGIGAEQIGEKPNLEPEAIAHVVSEDLIYRQGWMNSLSDISIFGVGGVGTALESYIPTLSHQLLDHLPAPIIFVDPANIFQYLQKQIEVICSTVEIEIDGKVADLTKIPLAPGWLARTIHRVPTFFSRAGGPDAIRILDRFMNDPKAYWRGAGIPPAAIETSYQTQIATRRTMGLSIPRFMKDAAETYVG